MKPSRSLHNAQFTFGVLTVCIIILLNAGCQDEQGRSLKLRDEVEQQISVGMSRTDVIAKIEKMAWRRYTCEFETWLRDVYLLGSHNVDKAAMLILTYDIKDGETTLKSISTFENYMLGGVTSGCDFVTLQ